MKLPSLSDEEMKLLTDAEKIVYKKLKRLVEQSSAGDAHVQKNFRFC
jgi:hypothetical protein